jgi:hypothetical protein
MTDARLARGRLRKQPGRIAQTDCDDKFLSPQGLHRSSQFGLRVTTGA